MAASQEQKVDYLLKKIGYTASKTGIAEDSSLSGTKKAPFGEAIPSPLVIPSNNIWSDSSLIPTTPPTSNTSYVGIYTAGTSGFRLTVDNTVSGNRSFIARSVWGDNSSSNVGDWIDTQFGSDYVVKVYKGDPASGGVQLSAAGSGSNDTWFFDYSSGVLNFNGSVVPTGITTDNVYIVGYKYTGAKGAQPAAGVATFSSLNVSGLSTFVGGITGTISTATKLETARTFEITGDVVASPISFDGTGNVSLAATIQPNSVGLGTDTFGDYVESISGTANEIDVTGGTGEGSTPVISFAPNPTIGGNVTIGNDLQVNNNLNVTGNITVGGTAGYILVNEFRVTDADIVLGFTTDISGNDVSNDTTANHGGIAVASTEGNPLVTLVNPGAGETLPATYKKIMWFKSGSFAGLNTDAWLSNYAIGIGSTQFPSGTRLAAGAVQITENDLAVVRNINASGIITGTLANNLTLNTSGTGLSGVATYNNSGVTTFTVTSNATSNNTPSTIVARDGSGNFSAGTITANLTGTATTATKLETSRDFSISGDFVTAPIVSFNGTGNVALAATITPNSIELGTYTSGDYVSSITNGSYITGADGGSEGAALTIGVAATSANTANQLVARDSSGNFSAGTITANLTGTATTATNLSDAANITTGNISTDRLSGTYSIDISGNAATATTATNSANVIGGIASVTQLSVSGISTFTNDVEVGTGITFYASTGIISATAFYGSGENLTDIIGTKLDGITVKNEGVPLPSAYGILDFVGDYVTATGVGTTATITFTDPNYASSAGIATYATSAGIATYASSAGIATYASSAGIATYASSAGIATYASSAGIATNIKGGDSGDIPYQTSADTTSFIDASSASSGQVLVWNGSAPEWNNVSAASGAFGGITVKDGGETVGTAGSVSTLNFVGSNIVATATTGANGIATITVADYVSSAGIATYATSAGIATYATSAGIATYATNAGIATYATNAGIATYATNAGIATYATNAGIATYATNAGIATYATSAGIATYATSAGIATYATSAGIATNVIGGIASVTSLNVSGISTLTQLSVNSSTGSNGQYLKATGSGLAWESFPTVRSTTNFNATASQTTFSVNYEIGYIDVYINGIRISDSEFTATNGTSVVLDTPCFGGEEVTVIAYNTTSTGGSFANANYSGIVTATGGFSSGTGSPVEISVVGSTVTLNVAGIGSTTFTLS